MKLNKKNNKNTRRNRNYKNKTLKQVIRFKGGAWYSYFFPNFLFEKKAEETTKGNNETEGNKTAESSPETSPESRKPEVTKENNKTKQTVNVRDLYKIESDDSRIDKEFFENPNISTWCFNHPDHKPVGMVHVTAVVGVNILRSYSTTVKNVVGFKGTIDENMHQLRNEIYIEMENVMKKKNIDKICNVGVAFTKDSGNLILSAFGTALRKKTLQ